MWHQIWRLIVNLYHDAIYLLRLRHLWWKTQWKLIKVMVRREWRKLPRRTSARVARITRWVMLVAVIAAVWFGWRYHQHHMALVAGYHKLAHELKAASEHREELIRVVEKFEKATEELRALPYDTDFGCGRATADELDRILARFRTDPVYWANALAPPVDTRVVVNRERIALTRLEGELDRVGGTIRRYFDYYSRDKRLTRRYPLYWPALYTGGNNRPTEWRREVTSAFGLRRHPITGRWRSHSGLDIRGDFDTMVVAAAEGEVIFAGRHGRYGNLVVIDHGETGYLTRYAHLSRITVKPRQTVRGGEVIGVVGTTGRSTGPHLHFEIRTKESDDDTRGFAVDPQTASPLASRCILIPPDRASGGI